MNNLYIIIINFNSKDLIIDCIKSIIGYYPKVNIIAVDNASSDESLQLISLLKYERISIIKNNINLGFAKAVNKGIKFALKQGAQEVLLLNPDTIATPGFLEPLLGNKAEIVGPIIKFKRQGDWVYDFGGKINFWLGRTSHFESLNPKSIFNQSDYLSGCCLLIKRKAFEKIGFLNENYFLFFEDVDFCLRAKKASFKIALEPKSIIIHKLSEGRKKPFYYMRYLIRSNLTFINHWLPFYRRPLAYVYLLLLSFKMLLNRI